MVVGLVPAAKHFTKQWLPERFVALGEMMAKKHRAKIFVFGGKTETDYCGDIAQMINANLGLSVAESFAGKFSLLETAAALDFCGVVVSNDTGLMHLAAARKKKVVALFGSTVREFGFFPYGTDHIVVEQSGLPCRPCSHIGLAKCPEGHFKCMKDTTVEQVVEAAEKLLA
jgi:ADP-heptose:LPS heptosyltransferase